MASDCEIVLEIQESQKCCQAESGAVVCLGDAVGFGGEEEKRGDNRRKRRLGRVAAGAGTQPKYGEEGCGGLEVMPC